MNKWIKKLLNETTMSHRHLVEAWSIVQLRIAKRMGLDVEDFGDDENQLVYRAMKKKFCIDPKVEAVLMAKKAGISVREAIVDDDDYESGRFEAEDDLRKSPLDKPLMKGVASGAYGVDDAASEYEKHLRKQHDDASKDQAKYFQHQQGKVAAIQNRRLTDEGEPEEAAFDPSGMAYWSLVRSVAQFAEDPIQTCRELITKDPEYFGRGYSKNGLVSGEIRAAMRELVQSCVMIGYRPAPAGSVEGENGAHSVDRFLGLPDSGELMQDARSTKEQQLLRLKWKGRWAKLAAIIKQEPKICYSGDTHHAPGPGWDALRLIAIMSGDDSIAPEKVTEKAMDRREKIRLAISKKAKDLREDGVAAVGGMGAVGTPSDVIMDGPAPISMRGAKKKKVAKKAKTPKKTDGKTKNVGKTWTQHVAGLPEVENYHGSDMLKNALSTDAFVNEMMKRR